MIKEFQGDYRWLSNFWRSPVEYEGVIYPTVENAYQAAKTLDLDIRQEMVASTPGQAKRKGKIIKIREDWDKVKISIMRDLLYQKFSQEPFLGMLLDTGSEEIQEGNYWHDTYWGIDLKTGQGENRLGKLIMSIRKELREEEDV